MKGFLVQIRLMQKQFVWDAKSCVPYIYTHTHTKLKQAQITIMPMFNVNFWINRDNGTQKGKARKLKKT